MPEQQPPQEPFHCDREQYLMLQRCSDAEDITEWNEWRKANPHEEIWLQRGYFSGAHLRGADFSRAHLERAQFSIR